MKKKHTFFVDKAATGIGNYCLCGNYDKIVFSFDVDTDSTLTVKFQGSIQDTQPNFATAQTSSNQWDYIEVVDLQDGAPIDGDTGVSVTAAQDHRMFQANVDALTYCNAIVTARTGGAVTVKGVMFNLN